MSVITSIDECSNTAEIFVQHATRKANTNALVLADGTSYTFGELSREVSGIQEFLKEQNLKAGSRVLVLVPIDLEFYKLLLGLFSSAMTVVFVDPGMGLKKMFDAIKVAEVDAVVSIDKFLSLRWFKKDLRRLKLFSLTNTGMGKIHLKPASSKGSLTVEPRGSDNTPTLVSFTSGTTGQPKGANRTQSLLKAQMKALINQSSLDNESIVHMTSLPVVVLHNLTVGETSVIPDGDIAKPGSIDPFKILNQIQRHQVTRLSAAPAFLTRISEWLKAHPEDIAKTRTLQEIVVGGAPVYSRLLRSFQQTIPHVEIKVIYGSTEAEPISSIDGGDVLTKINRSQSGYCVGQIIKETSLILARLPQKIPHNGLPQPLTDYEVQRGEVGEILVAGDHVLKSYVNHDEANHNTKIPHNGEIWHRTGDLAYQDAEGNLWLQGRGGDEVYVHQKPVYPFAIEAAINDLDCVEHSALIQPDINSTPTLFLTIRGQWDVAKQSKVLAAMADLGIPSVHHQVIDEMPLDNRHNSKILRTQLKQR